MFVIVTPVHDTHNNNNILATTTKVSSYELYANNNTQVKTDNFQQRAYVTVWRKIDRKNFCLNSIKNEIRS